jgi:glycosyltransferase 2 family protein
MNLMHLSKRQIIQLTLSMGAMILLMGYFSSKVDITDTVQKVLVINIWFIIMFVATTILKIWIRAFRFKLFFKADNWDLFHINSLNNFLLSFVPLKLGELSAPLLLKKISGIPMKRSFQYLILTRAFDLGVLMLFAVSLVSTELAVALIILSAATIFLSSRYLGKRLRGIPFFAKLGILKDLNRNHLLGLFGLSVLLWIVNIVTGYLFFPMAGVQVDSIMTALKGQILIGIISLLPLNGIAGYGTTQGYWVLAYSLLPLTHLALPEAQILEVSFIGQHLQTAVFFVLGVISWVILNKHLLPSRDQAIATT